MKYNYHYGPATGQLVQVTDDHGCPVPFDDAWSQLVDSYDQLTQERT